MQKETSQTTTNPVLVITFNRPDNARRVFEAIRQARPPKLFIAADAPRANKPGEKELCDQTKKVFDAVDWPCEVYTDYLETNIGPCRRVPAAITWFFSHVDRGFIFEDDCLPDTTFFPFCDGLLEKYKDDRRVMNISGSNFQDGRIRGDGSYYFSRYATTWGWATWKRAWDLYDTKVTQFPTFVSENKISNVLPGRKKEQAYWISFFKKTHEGKFIFWDITWLFTIWNHDAVSIIPNKNLVTNIGFGADATHTKEDLGLSIPTQAIDVIVPPTSTAIDESADKYIYKKIYKSTFFKKVVYKVKEFFQKVKQAKKPKK